MSQVLFASFAGMTFLGGFCSWSMETNSMKKKKSK